jgi:hypothetical protein
MQKYFGVLLALIALALAACSNGGASSSSPINLSGVVITTPSPTPVPTITAGPTATPANALNDGGFESGAFSATAGWTACSIPHPNVGSTAMPTPAPFAAVGTAASIGAVIVSTTSASFQVAKTPAAATTPAIFSGSFAALTYSGTGAQTAYEPVAGTKTGVAGANGICQTVTIPAGAELSMFVNEGGSDNNIGFADQEADIIPVTGANAGVAMPLFAEFNAASDAGSVETGGTPPNQTATAGGTYVMRGPYALTAAPYNLAAGQSVQLFIGSFDSEPSTSFGAYLFVDNVVLTGPSVPAALHRATTATRTSSK